MRTLHIAPLLLALGCQASKGDTSFNDACSGHVLDENAALAPDFCLVDLNTNSSRVGEAITPRDYLQQVSGWYFIHST